MRTAIIAGLLLIAVPAMAQTPATGPSAVSPVAPGGAQSPTSLGQPPAAAPANSPTVPEQISPNPVGPSSTGTSTTPSATPGSGTAQ